MGRICGGGRKDWLSEAVEAMPGPLMRDGADEAMPGPAERGPGVPLTRCKGAGLGRTEVDAGEGMAPVDAGPAAAFFLSAA